jgi:N-acetylmuramoyl-L-alanine amidase
VSIFFLIALLLPQQVVIATPRGQVNIPVTNERDVAAVAAVLLFQPLGLATSLDGSTVRAVTVSLNSISDHRSFGMAVPRTRWSAVCRKDTCSRCCNGCPTMCRACSRVARGSRLARLDERTVTATAAAAAPVASPGAPTAGGGTSAVTAVPSAPNPITGLRLPHTIVVDPGHGGVDPGNPGMHFPRGLAEKDITLGIGRLLRAELLRRGLTVVLTRATDTLIDLANRPLFCRAECDLFVSIHVNAMPAGKRQEQVSGVETYFLSDAKTEDQKRVAQMENDALRFETTATVEGPLAYILRDLQLNEYLRESARLAALVQGKVAEIHPGEDRGVQQGPFMVLAAARRPSILVETGFATNRDDGAFLASASGQHKIASAIADGVVAYLLEFERKLAVGSGGGQAR